MHIKITPYNTHNNKASCMSIELVQYSGPCKKCKPKVVKIKSDFFLTLIFTIRTISIGRYYCTFTKMGSC